MIKQYEKYLPSKKFRVTAMVLTGVLVLVLLVVFIFSNKQIFAKKENLALVQNQSIKDLLTLDTDRDGIVDWEETLWGTDKNNPNSFGIPDIEYIENRKAELEIEQAQNDKAMTETDMFAREFFATYTALQTSGLDQDSINNFSNALGARLSDPTLPNVYGEKDIKIAKENTSTSQKLYYSQMKNLFDKYSGFGLGDELDIVNEGLINYTEDGLSADYSALPPIGQAYMDFAKDAKNIAVPSEFAPLHLRILNGAHNTGISVKNMGQTIIDPIIGLGGVSQYDKYSNDFVDAVGEIEAFLIVNAGVSTEDTMYNGDEE